MSLIFGLENHFYHASIRRYVALFGSIFTDFYIKRKSEETGREDTILVPIKYGNGNVYMKVPQDGSREDTRISRILPAMAFELSNIYKDASRETNSMNVLKNTTFDSSGMQNWQFNRVPYNFIFTLYVRTKNIDDGLQILEQIIPAFNGNLSITIEDISNKEIESEQDIIIRLNEIDIEDNYQDEMMARIIDYKITFELKGYLYKKTKKSYILKEIDIISKFDLNDKGFENSTLLQSITNQDPIHDEQNNLSSMYKEIDNNLFSAASTKTIESKAGTKKRHRKERKAKS